MRNTRTNRILYLYHIFYYCQRVSFGMIREYIPEGEVSKKTLFRYIKLLEDAGLIRLRYSKADRAYIPVDNFFVPRDGQFYPAKFPAKKSQRLYMEKIIRLCTLMSEMVMYEVENPIAWYRKRYPELSDRTRQRDFKQLREVDYCIDYVPESEDPPGGYCYNWPLGW